MKTLITFLTCIALTFSLHAQTDKQTIADINKNITDIKNRTSTFQKVEKVNTPEGYKYVFLKDKELQLITVREVEENREKNVEWFYVKGALVYAETVWLDNKTKKVIKSEKQYLYDGHLLAWINPDGKLVDSNSSEFKTLDTELSTYAVKIKKDALK